MDSKDNVLKILHINNTDLPGRRFNGYDLMGDLESRAFLSKQLVLDKESNNPAVIPLKDTLLKKIAAGAIRQIEKSQSFDNLISPWADAIRSSRAFKEADVIHYHLFHNNIIAIDDFAEMTKLKPSVWTCHDPWPFTGHCIHPIECEGYKNACIDCPYLTRDKALKKDTSNFHYKKKRKMIAEQNATVVFASQWMKNFCTTTPIGKEIIGSRIINFGIDPMQALPFAQQRASRQKYEIPLNDFVIFFRRDDSPFKGLKYIYEALQKWDNPSSVTLLSVGGPSAPKEIKERFNVIEFEWLSDSIKMFELYNASDIFLMPSTAEAFGMMALEAMICELPVICFDGTALPEIVGAPEYGISVRRGNSVELLHAIKNLKNNREFRRSRGVQSRIFASQRYNYAKYLDSIATLYREVYEKFDS